MAVRKRTEAQRGQKVEKEDEVVIQDEQEQEEEIQKVRDESMKAKVSAQKSMDVGVLVGLLMNMSSIFRHAGEGSPFLLFLIILQTILLPLSFTPSRIKPLEKMLEQNHLYIAVCQFGLLLASFSELDKNNWGLYDIAQLSLPLTVACGVEIQRRGDRDIERRLQSWEATKYDVKGA